MVLAKMQTKENPVGTDGFEFIEFTSPAPEQLGALFESMGFRAVSRHRRKNVRRYNQGDINFLLNMDATGQAADFRTAHGSSINAMAFRVRDAAHAMSVVLARGAVQARRTVNSGELDFPAIEGIGGSHIYLVDRYGSSSIYDVDFEPLPGGTAREPSPPRLLYIDHLTHNVRRGNLKHWADFYERVFGFREIRHFDIEGRKSALVSKAMTSPDGKIRIPLNESQDDKSQIEEFLESYGGEGIQHIALGTADIYNAVPAMISAGLEFQQTPDTYYEAIDKRIPDHGERVEELRRFGILIDGSPQEGEGILLQIFTRNVIGPCFFELIQRKGNEGFGEGNFKALFESLELDQIRRGVL
jgi:4-hydroxyphenylpyruvate dioxygenase